MLINFHEKLSYVILGFLFEFPKFFIYFHLMRSWVNRLLKRWKEADKYFPVLSWAAEHFHYFKVQFACVMGWWKRTLNWKLKDIFIIESKNGICWREDMIKHTRKNFFPLKALTFIPFKSLQHKCNRFSL